MIFPSTSIKFYKYTRTYLKNLDKDKLNVLFFGTDDFSLPSLTALHRHISRVQNLGVVTSFKSPSNCVRLYAEKHHIHLCKWPISVDACRAFDLGVVVSFGHLLPTHIIKSFPLGIINVHASLLPRWRGAAPIVYAIMNGDKETGVSIMRVEPKHFDIGDILARRCISIKPDIYMPDLHKILANLGADLLLEVIQGYPQTFENPFKQNEQEATYAPKITPALTEIDWKTMSARDIYNRHRALYTLKTLKTNFNRKSFELLDIRLPPPALKSSFDEKSQPGSLEYKKERKCLQVKCANNTYIEVFQVRLEGKRAMSAVDFNNGFLKKLSEKNFLYNKTAVCC